MKKMPASIIGKLDRRKAENAFRELMVKGDRIDFFSNDYLGMARLPYGGQQSHGSTGSRLISGNSIFAEQLEAELATFFGHEAGLFFNSGYDANLGFFSSIPVKGDTILYDELVHASIRDGIRLSFAKAYSFRHNDIKHLDELLRRSTGTVYVAVESIYSMDGDACPLEEVAQRCDRHGAFLVVDEAHGAGVFGPQGKGLVSEYGLEQKIFARLITFGKAYGSHGALVLCDRPVKEYLLNFARSLIYTTALPDHALGRIQFVVSEVARADEARQKLKENIDRFNASAADKGLVVLPGRSPIRSIVIPGNDAAKNQAARLLDGGFAVKAILSPTVPKGQERIRICLHSFNTTEEINALIDILS